MNTYHTYSDEQLLQLLKTSDEAAFTAIYHNYWKLLLSIAANKLPTVADAEEIVQEVFADLWKRRHELQVHHSLKSFLAAATKYQVYSMLARIAKEKRIAHQEIEDLQTTSLQEEIESTNLFEQLQREASTLPDRVFLVYKLSRVSGLNNKEIAAQLGSSEKTIEGQLTRALRHLRAAVHLVTAGLFFFL